GTVTTLANDPRTRPITISDTTAFTTADLTGTWRLYGLAAAAKPGTEGEWIVGTLAFDAIGELTQGNLTWADGAVTTLTAGSPVHIGGSGIGTIQTTFLVSGRFTRFEAIGLTARMTQNKQVIVGVMPTPGEISPDFRTSDTFFSFLLLVKESSTTFYQTDLSGTWRVYGLGTPRFPAVTPLGAIGTLSMDGSGALGTFVQVDGTVETLGGRLTLAEDCLISGTIS